MLTAERRDFVDASLDAYVRASRRHAAAARHDGHLTRPIVHLIELERDERHAPRVVTTPSMDDGAILIAAGVVFELLHCRSTCAARSPTRNASQS